MKLQMEQHERMALAHFEAFYEILGQRRELWESGDEFIQPHDLRYGKACYLLGAAQWSVQLAMWHLDQANPTGPLLFRIGMCLNAEAEYTMETHWENVTQ